MFIYLEIYINFMLSSCKAPPNEVIANDKKKALLDIIIGALCDLC
jgi:hypothetical protein